ncbi:MAG: alpha-ketoglutarate-dependent dioxygenase AlkB family protein [Geminicoccaceae bacterium]
MSKAITSFARNADPLPGNLLPQDGKAYLIEQALSSREADRAFSDLLESIDWQQAQAFLFGRTIPLPRLTAWHGDHGYSYSGIRHEPAPFTPLLAKMKASIEAITRTSFNSVLINLYRGGQDSMGWHSDDEPTLGPEPEIASLSLGARRRFHFKHRRQGDRIAIDLDHGSCLIMRGQCQANWQHQLPKTRKKVGPRINLTFRTIQG